MKKISFVTVFMMGIMLTLGGLAWSAKGSKGPKGAELVKEATVTIDQAIKTARENVSGPVGEAELKHKDGKTVWEVEIAGADSKVMKVFLDAQSGAVMSTEEKNRTKNMMATRRTARAKAQPSNR